MVLVFGMGFLRGVVFLLWPRRALCVMSVVGGIDAVDCDGVTVSVVSVGAAAMNATAVMVVVGVVLTIVLSLGKSSLQLSWL